MTTDVLFHRPGVNASGVSAPYDSAADAARALYGKDAEGAVAAMVTLPNDTALMQFLEAMTGLAQGRLQAAMRAMLMPTAQVMLWNDRVTTRAGDHWKVLCAVGPVGLQMQGPQGLPPPPGLVRP